MSVTCPTKTRSIRFAVLPPSTRPSERSRRFAARLDRLKATRAENATTKVVVTTSHWRSSSRPSAHARSGRQSRRHQKLGRLIEECSGARDDSQREPVAPAGTGAVPAGGSKHHSDDPSDVQRLPWQDALSAAIVAALLAGGLMAVAAVATSAAFFREGDWGLALLALTPAPLCFVIWPGIRGKVGIFLWIPFAGTTLPLALKVLA